MTAEQEVCSLPNKKFVLIAHERGTDRYVLADENANLLVCNGELVSQHRKYETLISFNTLKEILERKGRAREGLHLIPPNSAEDYVNQNIRNIIVGAVTLLGHPPKERINFFSIPKEVVDKFDWVSRKY